MHLTLVPYIAAAGELKTKPTQHSVKELRSIGIQPDMLICRSEHRVSQELLNKIALFANMEQRAVFSLVDAKTIYQIPSALHAQELDNLVVEKLQLQARPADLKEWQTVIDALEHPQGEVTVAMVGKYVDLVDCYKSLNEALLHAGIKNRQQVNIHYVDAEEIETQGAQALLENVDAILIPGGFGQRGFEGKILAVEYARHYQVPYLGICLGLQAAVIEYARHQGGMPGAHSTEFQADTPYPVVGLVTEWRDSTGRVKKRSADAPKGGTMRLGSQGCKLKPNTLAQAIYQQDTIFERHRHRYEVNNQLVPQLEQHDLIFSGYSKDDDLVEIVEIPSHPWFLACQFHPEFKSTPRDGHPLFINYIQAAQAFKKKRSQTEK
jgi:CTP synthase